jgi:hypothetical protein
MRKIAFLMISLLCACSAPALFAMPLAKMQEQKLPEGPKIRVLLIKDEASAFLEVKGNWRVIRKDVGEVLSYGVRGKRFVVHALADGLRWGEEFPGINQFTVVPTRKETKIYVNGMPYEGQVTVYHVPGNRVAIVNELAIEEFIKSTLMLKCTEDLSKDAKEAMAILERSAAFARLGSKRPWDVRAEEARYYGCSLSSPSLDVEKCVDATRFMVLQESSGTIVDLRQDSLQIKEVAQVGQDAQKILKQICPKAKLGITIDPEEIVVR